MASQYLMLPIFEAETQEFDRLSLYCLKDKKPYCLNTFQNLKDFKDVRCVGSCEGWLAFLDNNDNPFLLDAFSTARIHLPPTQTLPCREKNSTIVKLVLSSLTVVVMYQDLSLRTKIAFCRQGDENWSGLDCEGTTYYDIVCCDRTNMLFALSAGPLVESWDLTQTVPKKRIIIQDSCPRSLQLARQTFPSDLYASQWYLAVSPEGQIFLIVRYIGEFMRYDGEVVYEGDTLTDDAAEPLVCPYRTVDFRVYRVEGDAGESVWVDVECLNEYAVFLGGNQTVMVRSGEELKRNAIYFTDDYWERMDEDYSYGGHDMGVFSLEDGCIEGVVKGKLLQQKIQPPPIWLVLHRFHLPLTG